MMTQPQEKRHEIKAVAFDLGNVLVDFNHRIAAEKMSAFTKKTPQEIYDLFFDSEITGLFEEGKIGPRQFHMYVKLALDSSISFEEFLPIWNEIFFVSDKNQAVLSLAALLQKRYKTALITNINVLHFAYVKARFQVFAPFHTIVASCEEKVRKPHHSIYSTACRSLGISPESLFYTDDRIDLIEGARKFGIVSFLFSGVEQLKSDLKNCGVEIGT